MPYSSRTLVAALLLLGTAQAGFKALALPLPTLAAPAVSPSTTFPVPDPEPAAIAAQRPGDAILAQASPPPSAPTAQPSGLSAWWWLLPIAAGGAGALGWAASRRKPASSEDSAPEALAAAYPDLAASEPAAPLPTADTPPTALETPDPWLDSPVAEEIPEPVAADIPEPSVEEIPEPIAAEIPEPVVEDIPESIAADIPKPSVEEIPEPIAAESPEPVVEDIPEPAVVEEIPEPVEEIPEPIAAESPEPAVVEDIPEPVAAAESPAPPDLEPPVSPTAPLAAETPLPQPSATPRAAVATELTGLSAGAAGLAAGAAAAMASTEDQTEIEASKFNVVGQPTDGDIDLSTIDDGLPPLPDGYGESRIVLMPRDPQWAYVYWDTPHTHKEDLRRQGGERLALRLYDVTNIDRNYQAPHGMQQCDCDELARDWYLQIPVSDRDYQAEIGYLARDGRWLLLARSNTIHIPPIYPSDWSEDHFKTVTWEEDLRGKTLMTLVDPTQKARSLHEQMYALSQVGEAERVDGSVYGSMQHVPGSVPHVPGSAQQVAGSIQHVAGSMAPYASAESSYAWGASGAGLLQGMPGPGGAVPTLSGIGMMSGIGMGVGMSGVGMSGVGMSGLNVSGLNVSGLTMSGISGLTMSGVGFSASMPPARPRKFWLVADAELIVHGATEPDATVTIAGQPISLSDEGTFRVHTSFPDGNIDYPIMAVAADGEQSRSIHMTFDRQTPDRQTNTQEDAQDEWFPS